MDGMGWNEMNSIQFRRQCSSCCGHGCTLPKGSVSPFGCALLSLQDSVASAATNTFRQLKQVCQCDPAWTDIAQSVICALVAPYVQCSPQGNLTGATSEAALVPFRQAIEQVIEADFKAMFYIKLVGLTSIILLCYIASVDFNNVLYYSLLLFQCYHPPGEFLTKGQFILYPNN